MDSNKLEKELRGKLLASIAVLEENKTQLKDYTWLLQVCVPALQLHGVFCSCVSEVDDIEGQGEHCIGMCPRPHRHRRNRRQRERARGKERGGGEGESERASERWGGGRGEGEGERGGGGREREGGKERRKKRNQLSATHSHTHTFFFFVVTDVGHLKRLSLVKCCILQFCMHLSRNVAALLAQEAIEEVFGCWTEGFSSFGVRSGPGLEHFHLSAWCIATCAVLGMYGRPIFFMF